MNNVRAKYIHMKQAPDENGFLPYDLEYLCSQLFALEIKFAIKHFDSIATLQKNEDFNTYDLFSVLDSYQSYCITSEK